MRLPISPWLLAAVVLCTLTVALLAPALASAHGSGTPSATNFLAKITHTPDGLEARVVDGDVRMWLRVPGDRTVTVLDTTGAPYLRFSPAGVAVNLNSAIYYLSQNPPLAPPRGITAKTRPRWVSVSAGHSYRWVDERLQALALVARAPGVSYVGTWRIPLRIDGRITAITGGLWYRGPPTLVWFWPIFVLLMCVLAALRLRRAQLNLRIARAVAGLTLLGIAVGAIARGFHERPGLSASALILCAVILMLVAGAAWLLRIGTGEAFTYTLIAVGGLSEAGTLIPTLFHGYVLLAVPGFIARGATVVCIAGGVGLIVMLGQVARAFPSEAVDDLVDDLLGGAV
jgi:hypothetical protein